MVACLSLWGYTALNNLSTARSAIWSTRSRRLTATSCVILSNAPSTTLGRMTRQLTLQFTRGAPLPIRWWSPWSFRRVNWPPSTRRTSSNSRRKSKTRGLQGSSRWWTRRPRRATNLCCNTVHRRPTSTIASIRCSTVKVSSPKTQHPETVVWQAKDIQTIGKLIAFAEYDQSSFFLYLLPHTSIMKLTITVVKGYLSCTGQHRCRQFLKTYFNLNIKSIISDHSNLSLTDDSWLLFQRGETDRRQSGRTGTGLGGIRREGGQFLVVIYMIESKLLSQWGIWFIYQGESYEGNVHLITKVGSYADLAYLWKHSPIASLSNYFLNEQHRQKTYLIGDSNKKINSIEYFRDGIEPKWEDPQNQNGGRFIFQVPKTQQNKEQIYEQLTFFFLGEHYERSEKVNGFRFISSKVNNPSSYRAEIWVNFDESDTVSITSFQEVLIAMFQQLDFKPKDSIQFRQMKSEAPKEPKEVPKENK